MPQKEPIRLRDYRDLVPEYSWWRSKDQSRTFVAVKVLATDSPDVPDRVWLLEMPQSEPNVLEGVEMVESIESGALVRWKHVIPTPPDAWDKLKRLPI